VTAFQIAALAVGLAACATDVLSRKVPNTLTGFAVISGVAAHTLLPGGQGLVHAAIGMLVGLAVFFPFFALGGMGGGDVKLMAALGTWIGWSPIVWTALYGAVAGGVMAVAVGLAHGYLRQAISNIGGLLVFWATQGIKPVAALTLEHGHGPRLPYALPIFVGLVVTLWRH
jgi:prepilin peptidase CpaA